MAAPPTDDPITLRLVDGRLSFARFSVPVTVDSAVDAMIELPVNPTLPLLLQVRMTHSQEAIDRSGLAATITAAEAERDKLVERAAVILQPLGITSEQLRNIIRECVRQ